MISFFAIRIQACGRGYFARNQLRILKKEKQDEIHQQEKIVKNAAATAIVSAFDEVVFSVS